jgi:long-chain fatty acid transport protein
MKKSTLFALFLLFSLFTSGNIMAQSNEEVYQGFQFNFFPPGARAMAMGGAFIGLADDATAAYSNPAGMVILTKPEISAVGKFSNYTTLRAADWNSFLTRNLTEFSGGTIADFGFASVVIPLGQFSFGLSMTNFINYQEGFTLQARPIPLTEWAYRTAECYMDLQGYNFSASIATRISDIISIGVTVNYSTMNINTSTLLRDINWSDFSDISGTQRNEAYTDDSGNGIGFTAGVLISPTPKISIGAVYSYNPKIEYVQGFWRAGNRTTGVFYSDITLTLDIPDRFGAGISYRPFDELVVIADVVMIQYSQISANYVSTYDYPELGIYRGDDNSAEFDIPDTTEIHVGAEYALLSGKTPIFFRAGFFTNPNHRPSYLGIDLGELFRWNLIDYSDQIKETEIGFTFGIGVVIDGKIQIDGAYVISDSLSQGIISLVYHL